MANDKLHGYNPDPKKEADGNRLDKFNPREFRIGMDYELTAVGCSRLAESTEDERRKATETVLGNLEEHNGYYTSLITYETQFRNDVPGVKKPSFKAWLAEQNETKMQEVDYKYKNDKMSEPKAKSQEVSTKADIKVAKLKESIANEVRSILFEAKKDNDDFDGPEDDEFAKGVDKKMKKKKKKDRGDELDAELNDIKKVKSELEEKHEKAKEKSFPKYQKDKDVKAYKTALSLKDSEINKLKSLANKYTGKETGYNIPAIVTYKEVITLLDKRVTANKKEQEQFLKDTLKEKRDVSKMEMSRKDHLRLLEIIKEYGVNLREGTEAIKIHYEIAKASYLEGIAKGMKV